MNLSSKAKIKMADQMLKYLGKLEEEENDDIFSEESDELEEDIFSSMASKPKIKVTALKLSNMGKKKA